ncbi:50S ribosomal protein L4 [Candidatus Pacearchaeota archaeon]|nr:50S ribosomal protein L4 [Candidatus Pacearchaeota archaeon]
MKSSVLDINGKEKTKIDLPAVFSERVREDIVFKVIEAKKKQQPYAPNLLAGNQSASGKMRHRRHIWQTHYGRGMSRIPRKVMSRRGTQFNWIGADIPGARGGRRAHPPKILAMLKEKKINKKELRTAINSLISASANKNLVAKRYARLEEKNIKELPLIVEGKILFLNTKEFISSLKNILGEKLFEVALRERTQRTGRGKSRGRRYKTSAGMIIIIGNKEKIKSNAVEITNVSHIGVKNLGNGGPGRLAIYTEEAIKEIGAKK